MNIKDYLNDREFKTRKQLMAETGLSDREVRNKISELKLTEPVIYNSQTSGYRLVKNFEKLTSEQISLEILEATHTVNDIRSRINVLSAQEKTYQNTIDEGRKWYELKKEISKNY